MKKSKTVLLGGAVIAGLLLLSAILFTLVQYKFTGAGLTFGKYNGFVTAFGKDNHEGFFLFCLPFFFAIIGTVISVLAAFKFTKKAKVLFGTVAILALVSVIVYLVTYFHIMGDYKTPINLTKYVKWGFAFWGALVLNIVACAGSLYLAVSSGKK